MTHARFSWHIAAFVGAMLSTAACAEVQPLPLAAHRAVYELKMLRSSGAKALSDAKTVIAMEFSGTACEGYASNFHQFLEITPAEGPVRETEMRSVSFEDGAGNNFRFNINASVDGKPNEDLDGRATRSADGTLSVRLERPRMEKADLAEQALFPTDHIRHVVAAARAGETTLAAKVFDGSDTGMKIFDTLSVIGKPTTVPAPEKAAQVAELAGMTRWQVVISYFSPGKSDAPDYVLSFDLYENGIARALKLDYGEFVLGGDLSRLELLPTLACTK